MPPTVRESSSQQVNYFPSQFREPYPNFPMLKNSFTHFSIPQPAVLPLNLRYVADGEAHLLANAAASSVRHPAPQPANLPFHGQRVQRTPTQSQFAGFPLITPTRYITSTDTEIGHSAPHLPPIPTDSHNAPLYSPQYQPLNTIVHTTQICTRALLT